MRKQLELELQLELKLDLALHLATANEASAESERFTSKFTRDLTTNLAATEPTGRTEPWRLSVLTFQTKLLRGPPWPAKVMSSRVKTQEHCRAARRGAPRLGSCRTSYRCHTNAPMGVRVRARAALPLAVCQFGGSLLALPVASAAFPASASCHRRLLPCNSFSAFTSLLSSA